MDREAEIWATTYEDVRATLYSPSVTRWDEIDQREFVVGNVLENAIFALDGDRHRDRRRAESVLFSKARRDEFERSLVPRISSHVIASAESGTEYDLISLVRSIGVRIASALIGLSIPIEDDESAETIGEYARVFAVGAGIEESKREPEELLSDVRASLRRFGEDHFSTVYEATKARENQLDRDNPENLTEVMVLHAAELGMSYEDMVREAGFYLAAASDTTTQSVAALLHYVWDLRGHDAQRQGLTRADLQLWLHEALRIRSVVPLTHRRAIEPWELGGESVPDGAKLHVDLHSGSTDAEAYGQDAGEFNPHRALPAQIPRFGFAFGGGVHACLGKAFAAGGTVHPGREVPEDHLFGVVVTIACELLEAGVRPSPTGKPANDPLSKRWSRWDSYPVVL